LSEWSRTHYRRNTKPVALSSLAVFICLFGHLGAFGLVGPDEPRYAWIARAMARTGDWVTPRLYGQPWFEKPILYYWAAAAGFLLHLPDEWAARLPSAFAALLAAMAVGWLGWNYYGEAADSFPTSALLAPLLFSTSVAAIGFARAATPDMLFTAMLTLAMATAARVLRSARALGPDADGDSTSPRRDTLSLPLFGTFLGLAVLAKGPSAILLAGGAIGLWALATKRWREAIRLADPLAIAAFAIVSLPWYVLCAVRNPDFLRVFIGQHNVARYLTPVFQHQQPVWFFGPVILLALLPWTALLWLVAQEGLRLSRDRSSNGSPGLFFASWAVFPVLFFSLSQSKLPGYILPSLPPLALLTSAALVRALSRPVPSVRRTAATVGSAIGLTWVALGLSALHSMNRLLPIPPGAIERVVIRSASVAIVGGILVAVLGLVGRRSFVLLSVLLTILSLEIAGLSVLPSLDPYVSARWHAQFMHNDLRPERILTYRLKRSWTYGLAFYLGRELPEWSAADPEPALVLTTPQGLEEMIRLGRFRGTLDEPYKGILYVPAFPARRQ
jgi:4-amino-4-deoxy-L-arabinose transferase-like glycosyltransferase